jgi:hypothetical protein
MRRGPGNLALVLSKLDPGEVQTASHSLDPPLAGWVLGSSQYNRVVGRSASTVSANRSPGAFALRSAPRFGPDRARVASFC